MTEIIRSAAFILALLSASMAVPGCATTGTPTPVVTQIDHTVDCTASSIVAKLPAIVSEVATDLLAKDYLGLLTTLAQRVGDDLTVCAVRLSAESASSRMAATEGEQPNALAIKTNAGQYLTLRAVRFAEPAAETRAAALYCQPTCNACMVCTYIQPPVGVPPSYRGICLPRVPKPAGCP